MSELDHLLAEAVRLGPGFRAEALLDRRRSIIAEHTMSDSYQPDSVFPVYCFKDRKPGRIYPVYRVRIGRYWWLRVVDEECSPVYPHMTVCRTDTVSAPHEATVWDDLTYCARERSRYGDHAHVEEMWWYAGTVYRTRELALAAMEGLWQTTPFAW